MEHEIKDHVKKAYKVWSNSNHSFWEKVREIIIEIVIIVFAVSLSIWLHNLSEKRHEQKEVKAFLQDLKVDLLANKKEFERQEKNHRFYTIAFRYFSSRYTVADFNQDSIALYIQAIQKTDPLVTRTGQYESFKSSGKLINIENKKLLTDLMTLYQEDLPLVIKAIDENNVFKYKMQENAIKYLQLKNGQFTNFREVTLRPDVNIYADILSGSAGIADQLHDLAILTEKIIVAIAHHAE